MGNGSEPSKSVLDGPVAGGEMGEQGVLEPLRVVHLIEFVFNSGSV